MSITAEKVRAILEEIEPAEVPPKSAQEIADILLDRKSSSVQQTDNSAQMACLIDAGIFEEQLRLVNERWENPYYRHIFSCRPIIGGLIVFCKKIFRKIAKFLIEPITESQTQFNSATTNALNCIRNNDVVFDVRIRELYGMLSGIQNNGAEFDAKLDILNNALDRLQNDGAGLNARISRVNQEILEIQKKTEENQLLSEDLQVAITGKDIKVAELEERIKTLVDQFEKQQVILKELQEYGGSQIYTDIDYFDFEQSFRGTRPQIKENQRFYLPYFQRRKRVLDLGSGRGEFLELLRENQIPCTGVDLYGPFVDYCRIRGHEVVQEDAVRYLQQQKADCYDGIFAAQLAEHLSTEQLIALCRESYRILEQGGTLILETPNPTCLSTYTNSFYLDPSHVKPVHPKTLEYFLKKAGFSEIHVLYTEQSKVPYRFPLLDTPQGNLAEFNDGINFMSDILLGSQDYAIIAVK